MPKTRAESTVRNLHMPVRLKDIARDLGVSLITVSKAVRGMEDISEETRQRVLKRMAELNYRPNMMARGLASGKTYIVGLVVPDLLHPFFAEFAKSLNGVLRKHNYGLILTSSEEDPEIERQEIRTVLARGIDALLIASCQPTLEGFYGVEDQRTPFILIDRDFPTLRANFVGTDDHAAGLMATRHLLATGKRQIAHIAGPELAPGADRLRGYKDALREAGIAPIQQFVISNPRVEEIGEDVGRQAMQTLLKSRPRPDAVFCYNDLTAIGAMHATLEGGLAVPQDIAFIGCGNVRYSDYLRIPLSSIDQSTSQLGEEAGKLALDIIKNGSVSRPRHIRLEPKLVVRASSAETAEISAAPNPPKRRAKRKAQTLSQ
jgi:LacI family transcriptional regulator